MEEVIGLRGTAGHGSLREWGVNYRELPLAAGGLIDWDALRTAIRPGQLLSTTGSPNSAPVAMQQHPHCMLLRFDMAIQAIKASYPECLMAVDSMYAKPSSMFLCHVLQIPEWP